MKGNRNFRKKVSMVTAVICTASSLPFAALADEGAGDNFNLDGTLPIVKNADEMDPIEIAIVVPPERTVPTEDIVMVKRWWRIPVFRLNGWRFRLMVQQKRSI
ncbi:MAG: hypothetical protein ACLR6B_05530 [Blautia sp.]